MTTPPDMFAALRAALDRLAVTDPEIRAGIAAVAVGESGMRPRTEAGWSGTANARIRAVFGARVAGMDDTALNRLKADDRLFFEAVYGGDWGRRNLGNTRPGDGFAFRGRGLIQITGRGNYARCGEHVGVDLLAAPDLANDPTVAAEIAVAYVKDRYKGGGWEAIKRAVGNAVASTETAKDAAFAKFSAEGTFAVVWAASHAVW